MKQYEEYKDSGVEWIGRVPSHWEVKRGKFCTKLCSGFPFDSNKFTNDEDCIGLIRIRDISNECTEMNYAGEYTKEAIVTKGEVLVGMDGDFNVAQWKGADALLNQRVCKVLDTPAVSSHYMFYLLPRCLKCINDVTYATTVKHLSTFDITNSFFPIPPLPEQHAIAEYLDAKCGEIDAKVAKEQKRIELLGELKQSIITQAVTHGLNPNAPLKDSGVEWIGQVPEHWEVIRMRFLCSITTGNKDTIDNEDDGAYPFYVRSPKVERINSYSFDGEAVLMAGDGVGAGKVLHYANGKFDFHQRVYCFYNYKKILTKLAFYYLQSNFKYKIEEGGAKNTVDSVRLPWLKDFPICIPPKDEQKDIVNYIEHKCAIFDASIAEAERKVALLQELKQSIITEVVTGKRKVC